MTLERTRQQIEAGLDEGLHIGVQAYISLAGRVVEDLAIGESRPGVPLTPDTLMLWLSSSKPVAAVAVMQLVERGQLELDDPVAQHLPEFAAGGKQSITIRQLLTHTGGFRTVDIGWPEATWDQIIARISAASIEPDWIPGQRAGYHPFTSWYILGEIVSRCSGQFYSDYVRSEIFLPLGMRDCWVGMPASRYEAYGERIALMPETDRRTLASGGVRFHRYATREGVCSCVPGANGYGPMHELGRCYEMFLHGGELARQRVLQSDSVAQIAARHRIGMFDETFKHTMDWGLGTIINSNQYGADTVPYGYGKYASPRAFGHSGSQSSVAFCDPAYELVVAAVFNGTPGEPRHQKRVRAFCNAVYEDLGLTS